MGDFAVFSTGYSKTIDIGEGGILLSDYNISEILEEYEMLPQKTEQDGINDIFFRKLYRLIRDNKEQNLSSCIWDSVSNKLKSIYIYNIPGIEQKCKRALKNLDAVILERRRECRLYESYLVKESYYYLYSYEEGSVPWRFSLFIQPEYKQKMISYLLKHQIPVSDWYPAVTPIFNIDDKFIGVDYMESRIINFPLLIGEDKIRQICQVINEFKLYLD